MDTILSHLFELDRLYTPDTLAEYEQSWQEVERQVAALFPGFTLAYAEIYNAGQERFPHGGMRHVLAPKEGGAM